MDKESFLAGFAISNEGFNAECPYWSHCHIYEREDFTERIEFIKEKLKNDEEFRKQIERSIEIAKEELY